MLDFDELQEFPKNASRATKSDFISDLMGTQHHQKTLYTNHDCKVVTLASGLLPASRQRSRPRAVVCDNHAAKN